MLPGRIWEQPLRPGSTGPWCNPWRGRWKEQVKEPRSALIGSGHELCGGTPRGAPVYAWSRLGEVPNGLRRNQRRIALEFSRCLGGEVRVLLRLQAIQYASKCKYGVIQRFHWNSGSRR